MVISTIISFRHFFSKLNELNLSLQGKSSTVLDTYDKMKAFEEKTGVMD
jgi:hypothetical protein